MKTRKIAIVVVLALFILIVGLLLSRLQMPGRSVAGTGSVLGYIVVPVPAGVEQFLIIGKRNAKKDPIIECAVRVDDVSTYKLGDKVSFRYKTGVFRGTPKGELVSPAGEGPAKSD